MILVSIRDRRIEHERSRPHQRVDPQRGLRVDRTRSGNRPRHHRHLVRRRTEVVDEARSHELRRSRDHRCPTNRSRDHQTHVPTFDRGEVLGKVERLSVVNRQSHRSGGCQRYDPAGVMHEVDADPTGEAWQHDRLGGDTRALPRAEPKTVELESLAERGMRQDELLGAEQHHLDPPRSGDVFHCQQRADSGFLTAADDTGNEPREVDTDPMCHDGVGEPVTRQPRGTPRPSARRTVPR